MAQNALNNSSSDLTIDPGASGDSFVQFDINTTGEFRIGVDDTDDSFRISQGSALGTNDTFVMTAGGERTMPLQPAFAASLGSLDANVTGNGTTYTFGTNVSFTEIFDQGSDFAISGAAFTAPISGRYNFFSLTNMQQTTNGTQANYLIVTSNLAFTATGMNADNCRNIGGLCNFTSSVFADMDAADVTTFTVVIDGIGADTADLGTQTNIGGFLVC